MNSLLPLLFVILWCENGSAVSLNIEVSPASSTIPSQSRVIDIGEKQKTIVGDFDATDISQAISLKQGLKTVYEVVHSANEQKGIASYVTEKCHSNHIYDPEEGACRLSCDNEHTYYRKLKVCVPNADYDSVFHRPICRNITIPNHKRREKWTIEILQNYHKLTSGKENYTLVAGGIIFCYPFSLNFILCARRALRPHEYELADNGLSLWLPLHHSKYSVGDFFTVEKTAYVCGSNISVEALTPTPNRYVAFIYFISCCISSASLILTICIFVVENEWKYHTKVLLCHILSLFAFYLVLIIRFRFLSEGTDLCVISGITLNFTFLAAFFWLNVFAYEVWKKLGTLQANPLNPPSHYLKFSLASIYAWGLPLAINAAAISANYLLPQGKQFNPQFRSQCWVSRDTKAHLVFTYIPAAAILTANVVFFLMTISKLRSIARDATVVNTRVHKQLLKIYLKLMIVMGVCWIMEVISALVGDDSVWWAFTDIINCLQGFFIFIIYLCRDSTLRAIRRATQKHHSGLEFLLHNCCTGKQGPTSVS